MRNGFAAFLVDTNVLVYAYDTADVVKQQRAITILSELGTSRTGALSAQVMGEFFVTVTRRIQAPLTLAEAQRSLTHYVRFWPIYDLTELTVIEATDIVQRHIISYWDGLIWATAKLNQVPNVLSEDFSDGTLLEGVRFRNPFTPAFDLSLLQGLR